MPAEPPADPDPNPEARQGEHRGHARDPGRTAPFGWVSLLVIALLVVGAWLVITRLTEDARVQDCVQSGRRNCAPIDDPGR